MSDDREFEFHYFVSYSHKTGHGNIRISRSQKVLTMDCVKAMQNLISDDFGVIDPVIINYILLGGY